MFSIFIQIASYRDPECKHTIHDLFQKATFPERIFVGLNWQFAEEDNDLPHWDEPYQARIRMVKFHYSDAKGCCWARSLTESMYQGEDYILNIDAHMRFPQGWDEHAIALHQKLISQGYEKPVLTYYPPAYLPPELLEERICRMAPHPLVVKGEERRIFLNARSAITLQVPEQPYLQGCIAAGFLFAPGSIIKDVPYDPHLYFFGEEITLAARLWTHGYDLFHPGCILAYHLYKRQQITGTEKTQTTRDIKIHIHDHMDANERNRLSYARVRHLVGTEFSDEEEVTRELNHYGLGRDRTLYQFSRFAGLDFAKVTSRSYSRLSIHFKERIPAGLSEETAQLESAEIVTRRAIKNDIHQLLSTINSTDSISILDLGALYLPYLPNLNDLALIKHYLALTISPSRAHWLRECIRGKQDFYVVAMNYAAERLPKCDVVLTGDLFFRLSQKLTWQLLDSIYHSGSRFLCVQSPNSMHLTRSPFFLPHPAYLLPGEHHETAVWDLTKIPSLFEGMPEAECRARRIILDTIGTAVEKVQNALIERQDIFKRLIEASRDYKKDDARKIFEDPYLKTFLDKQAPQAVPALKQWWALRRRNYDVAKQLIQHPLLKQSDRINSWLMHAISWDYFDDLQERINILKITTPK